MFLTPQMAGEIDSLLPPRHPGLCGVCEPVTFRNGHWLSTSKWLRISPQRLSLTTNLSAGWRQPSGKSLWNNRWQRLKRKHIQTLWEPPLCSGLQLKVLGHHRFLLLRSLCGRLGGRSRCASRSAHLCARLPTFESNCPAWWKVPVNDFASGS